MPDLDWCIISLIAILMMIVTLFIVLATCFVLIKLRLNESTRKPLYYDPSDVSNKPKQTDESWNNPPTSNVLMEVPELRSLNWNSQSSRSMNVVPPYFAYLFMQSGTGETEHRNLLQSENKNVDSQQQTEDIQ